ncbi:MAG: hypothetical protein U1E76_02045 [Planctomycetota bacterium]
MIATLLLFAAGAFPASGAQPIVLVSTSAVSTIAEDPKEELKKRQDALKPDDAEGHYQLALWAEQNNLKTDSKRILRKVIKIDPNHEKAREKLGYKMYKGKWRTDAEIERSKREEEEAEMKAKGLVKWQGDWIAKDVAGNLEKGLIFYGSVKLKSGDAVKGTIENWKPAGPVKVTSGTETKELKAEDVASYEAEWMTTEQRDRQEKGLALVDHEWLSKEEVEKRKEGKYAFENEWLSLDDANQRHSDLAKPWQFEAEYIALRTNCEHALGKLVLQAANDTYKKTLQGLGVEVPAEAKPRVPIILVANEEEYNSVGGNVQDEQDAQKSSNYSYFCHVDPSTGGYTGIVTYALSQDYTKFMAMQAAAELALRGREFGEPVPRWFVEGVACAEGRFFHDRLVKWSLDMLRNAGGLISLNNYFDPMAMSNQSILQAGLLINYTRSSEADAKVKEAYQAVLQAFKAAKNQGLEKAFRALEKSLQQNEKKIQEYLDKH